jgi:hypothetical protein
VREEEEQPWRKEEEEEQPWRKEEVQQPWLAACQVFDEMPKEKEEG